MATTNALAAGKLDSAIRPINRASQTTAGSGTAYMISIGARLNGTPFIVGKNNLDGKGKPLDTRRHLGALYAAREATRGASFSVGRSSLRISRHD